MTEREFEKYFRREFKVAFEPSLPAGFPGAVVIPALGEGDTLYELLAQLADSPFCVVLAINDRQDSKDEYKQLNAKLLQRLRAGEFPGVYWLDLTGENRLPTPGVGAVRRAAMDAALKALATPKTAENIILASLDADTLVDPDYAEALLSAFADHPEWRAVTLNFQHRADTPQEDAAVRVYEQYLRDYRDGLASAGSPYAYIPIGSAFAVRGSAYIACGGMRLREGGEDFYFLQAVRKVGAIGELAEVFVYPSARPSDRVPFGTGPRVRGIMAGEECKIGKKLVFSELKVVISGAFSVKNRAEFAEFPAFLAKNLTPEAYEYFKINDFESAWQRILANAAHDDIDKLRWRFFEWFDAFRTLKFVNQLIAKGF